MYKIISKGIRVHLRRTLPASVGIGTVPTNTQLAGALQLAQAGGNSALNLFILFKSSLNCFNEYYVQNVCLNLFLTPLAEL